MIDIHLSDSELLLITTSLRHTMECSGLDRATAGELINRLNTIRLKQIEWNRALNRAKSPPAKTVSVTSLSKGSRLTLRQLGALLHQPQTKE